jgi:branched-subunit amino acid aminotransferase/4-amino-4-deoxychorismate lyase
LLAGVTRALLLEAAPALGLTAVAEPVTLSRARAADAIFVTSSIRRATGALIDGGGGPASDAGTVTAVRSVLDTAEWA